MESINHGLKRFTWFTAFSTLVLICFGGLVTSRGAGLSVPDWPNTYGYNLFFFPVSQWIGGIFYEHTHRLFAAWVGLLTALLAVWLWARETRGRERTIGVLAILVAVLALGLRSMPVYLAMAAASAVVVVVGLWRFNRRPDQLRWLGLTALGAVIAQGVLGGLRVTTLRDEIGVFHGLIAHLFLVLLTVIAVLLGSWWSGSAAANPVSARLRAWVAAGTLLILGQLIMGATMRHQHAGLAIPDFPLAHGRVWPDTSPEAVLRYNQERMELHAARPITAFQIQLQMAHRLGALLVLLAVVAAVWRGRRELPSGHWLHRLHFMWLGLILLQCGLGALTIWTGKSADIATAHVATGAVSLVVGTMAIMAGRRAIEGRHRVARSDSEAGGLMSVAAETTS